MLFCCCCCSFKNWLVWKSDISFYPGLDWRTMPFLTLINCLIHVRIHWRAKGRQDVRVTVVSCNHVTYGFSPNMLNRIEKLHSNINVGLNFNSLCDRDTINPINRDVTAQPRAPDVMSSERMNNWADRQTEVWLEETAAQVLKLTP